MESRVADAVKGAYLFGLQATAVAIQTPAIVTVTRIVFSLYLYRAQPKEAINLGIWRNARLL